jgi:hypothetical protein
VCDLCFTLFAQALSLVCEHNVFAGNNHTFRERARAREREIFFFLLARALADRRNLFVANNY